MPRPKWVKRTSGLFWWWEWADPRGGWVYQSFAEEPALALYVWAMWGA